jgi:hypothetical protein
VWDSRRNGVSAVTVYKNVSTFDHDVDSSRNWVRKREKQKSRKKREKQTIWGRLKVRKKKITSIN